jgi:hypothetical protein
MKSQQDIIDAIKKKSLASELAPTMRAEIPTDLAPSFGDTSVGPQSQPSLAKDLGGAPDTVLPVGTDLTPKSKTDAIQARMDTIGQGPQTTKGKLAKALLTYAPTALGGAFGGLYGAEGAAQGSLEAQNTQRGQENLQRGMLQKELEDELNRQAHSQDIGEQIKGREATTQAIVAGRSDVVDKRDAAQMAKDAADNATKTTLAQAKRVVDLRKQGLKLDDSGKTVPIGPEDMSPMEQEAMKTKQVVDDLRKAQAEHVAAQTEALKNPDPNSPAQQRLRVAQQNLSMRQKEFEMHAFGTSGGQALPGSIIGADGKPIGTAFQANVAPTSATRTKIASAQNVKDQGESMIAFANDPKNAGVFGKEGGLKNWAAGKIGTDDPGLAGIGAQIESMASFLTTMHGARGAALAEGFKKTLQNKNSPEAFAEATRQYLLAADRLEKSGAANVTGGKPSLKTEPGVNGGWSVKKVQ